VVAVTPGVVVVVAVTPGVVVVVVAPGMVVVVAPAQVPALQLSQQLGTAPTHLEPPLGAVHFAWLDLREHFVLPVAVVRQHVTKPGAPQVDLRAHRTIAARHCFGRLPLIAAAFAIRATHWMYGL
jgi:hypothetical protein